MDLSAVALSARLGGRLVLDDVSARFVPGRVTAILGPNGAGKSTLVRALAGLIVPDGGEVRLGGDAIATLDARARARAIGYLPQDAAVHWNVRAREAVALGRLPHRSPHAAESEADSAAIARALAETGTEHLTDRAIATLSGGERARVLLARVLAGEPRWLLADEPLASLDPAHQIDILARLRAQAAAGRGVVLVVHDLVQAARAADDVLLLERGRVAAFGAAAAVLTPANLARVFGVRVAEARDADGRVLLVPVGRA